MNRMENIERTRLAVGESNTASGRNYIREVWNAMTKQVKQGVAVAEKDKTRTQFWVTIGMTTTVIPIVIALCSWFSVHLINYGAQQARQ